MTESIGCVAMPHLILVSNALPRRNLNFVYASFFWPDSFLMGVTWKFGTTSSQFLFLILTFDLIFKKIYKLFNIFIPINCL